jgi:hypothetical protein
MFLKTDEYQINDKIVCLNRINEFDAFVKDKYNLNRIEKIVNQIF